MRTRFFIYRRILSSFSMIILWHSLFSQDLSVFRALPYENNTQHLRSTITSPDTISLEGVGMIYSLSINAIIHQPQESSFTRVVLEDKDGHDYLVAESNWFRFDTTTVILDHYCEETAILNGITPAYLKCYMTGGATITLTEVHTSNLRDMRTVDSFMETRERVKVRQVTDIVNRINSYNIKHGRLWRAAVSKISLHSYNMRKCMDADSDCDTYLNNIQYYSGGLFEIGTPCVQTRITASPYVPSFDWRNRHGKCWLTPVKDQGFSGYCAVFAAVGMLESNILLHYNDTSNLNLSEQYVASYLNVDYNNGISRGSPVRFLKTDGTIDDYSMPFVDNPNYVAPTNRPEGEEHAYLNDYKSIYLSNSLSLDTLKKYIIEMGPGVCGFQCFETPYTHDKRIGGHAMTLSGYGTIIPDTIYTFCNGDYPSTQFPDTASIIGHTYWIYKNSWDVDWGHNGYMYAVYYNDDKLYMGSYAYFPKGMPNSNVSRNIICEDKDGDGLFNWGIGSNTPRLPVWTPDESDGDDSDSTKGHMDEFGYCEQLPADHPTYEYIFCDSIITTLENRTRFLGVLNGVTVTLHAQQNFVNGAKLLLDNGATLVIDGTTIKGEYIQPYMGSKIVLSNGAKILKPFNVPIGVKFVINKGTIE